MGGQYGSEGKGKVAAAIAKMTDAAAVVRVGGTNSGHTVVDEAGRTWRFRQIPAAAVHGAEVVLPSGSFVDVDILRSEIDGLGLDADRVHLSPYATVIERRDKELEGQGIVAKIGSTGSGTGAALARRVSRSDNLLQAKDCPALAPYVRDVDEIISRFLSDGRRIVIEGSQGFGLSLFHGGVYPHATSRDTTAGTFLGEAGIGPMQVDDVTLVVRTYPIRVGGNSGPLPNEIDWPTVARRANLPADFVERTTATNKVRRVACFDADVVRRAIAANAPTRLVLNHCDYLEPSVREGLFSDASRAFVEEIVERQIGRRVDWLGIGPDALVKRGDIRVPSRRVA